jgi:hypothetical protein
MLYIGLGYASFLQDLPVELCQVEPCILEWPLDLTGNFEFEDSKGR